MNQISPFKSSAVRITLVYVLLFGLSVSIILGFVYWSTIVYKTNQTDDDINAEIKSLSTIYARRGYPGLLRALNERVEQVQQRPGDAGLYLLTDDQFQPLVGNINRWPKVARELEWRLAGFSARRYSGRQQPQSLVHARAPSWFRVVLIFSLVRA